MDRRLTEIIWGHQKHSYPWQFIRISEFHWKFWCPYWRYLLTTRSGNNPGQKPITFYSRKTAGTQMIYTVEEEELLNKVETLK